MGNLHPVGRLFCGVVEAMTSDRLMFVTTIKFRSVFFADGCNLRPIFSGQSMTDGLGQAGRQAGGEGQSGCDIFPPEKEGGGERTHAFPLPLLRNRSPFCIHQDAKT